MDLLILIASAWLLGLTGAAAASQCRYASAHYKTPDRAFALDVIKIREVRGKSVTSHCAFGTSGPPRTLSIISSMKAPLRLLRSYPPRMSGNGDGTSTRMAASAHMELHPSSVSIRMAGLNSPLLGLDSGQRRSSSFRNLDKF